MLIKNNDILRMVQNNNTIFSDHDKMKLLYLYLRAVSIPYMSKVTKRFERERSDGSRGIWMIK